MRYSLKTLSVFLIAAVMMKAAVFTGCSSKPETYPEAETKVSEELEEIKASAPTDETFEALKVAAGEFDGAMLEGYLDKVKDFDYEIVGSQKAEPNSNSGNDNDNDNDSDSGSDSNSNGNGENACVVRVKITTYDFANEYLKAWNEYMTVEEGDRWQSQFYSHLLLRLASVANKDYISEVDVVCTDSKGEGNWETDIKSNEELMNALSGGMLDEIKKLMTDDVVMDETEAND